MITIGIDPFIEIHGREHRQLGRPAPLKQGVPFVVANLGLLAGRR